VHTAYLILCSKCMAITGVTFLIEAKVGSKTGSYNSCKIPSTYIQKKQIRKYMRKICAKYDDIGICVYIFITLWRHLASVLTLTSRIVERVMFNAPPDRLESLFESGAESVLLYEMQNILGLLSWIKCAAI